MWGFKKKTSEGFDSSSTAEQVTDGIDGSGLTAIVTGGTNGIGKETVRVLAKRGVHVVLAARNVGAAETVKEGIAKETPNARVDVLQLDLSSFESVRKAADEFLAMNLPLNVLVNNAGISCVPFELSKDGIEMQFETNYLGPFLLTNLLLEKLKATAKESGVASRIVMVSSKFHELFEYEEGIRFGKLNEKDGYEEFKAYGQSKLALILFARELARRLQEEGANVTVNALHPGAIKTNLISANHSLAVKLKFAAFALVLMPFFKSIPQGAATTAFLALNPGAEGVSGKYFCDCHEFESPSKFVKDADLGRRLWDLSIELTSP